MMCMDSRRRGHTAFITLHVKGMDAMKREHGYYCLYGLILLVCLMMAVLSALPAAAPADSVQALSVLPQSPVETLPEGFAPGLEGLITDPCVYPEARLWAGKLLLIDVDHPLPAQAPAPNTLSVAGGGAAARSPQTVAGEETIAALKAWFAAARQKGYGSPVVWAGTRSPAEQLQWQLDQLALYARQTDLVTAAQKTAAQREAPGCSEHQTGYAVDTRLCEGYNLPPDNRPLSQSPAGRFLLDTCWQYGFIHRYNEKDPPLCEEESYHFPYVGRGHAELMHALDLDFAAYLAFLRRQGALRYYEGDQLKYVVLCQPVSGDWALLKPRGAKAIELSMDNTGWAVALFSF